MKRADLDNELALLRSELAATLAKIGENINASENKLDERVLILSDDLAKLSQDVASVAARLGSMEDNSTRRELVKERRIIEELVGNTAGVPLPLS